MLELNSRQNRRWGTFFISVALVAGAAYFRHRHAHHETAASPPANRFGITKAVLAGALEKAGAGHLNSFPNEIDLPIQGKPTHTIVQYSFDPKLQETMEDYLKSYHPDYGAFVAIDATTGRILSLVSFTKDPKMKDNLALRAGFPSASVFKVVTAAAAISENKFSQDTVITFNGRNHTLYRSNILHTSSTKWTRHMTLKEAFAHSVNTVFGKIGAFTLGASRLAEYAGRFGFNRKIEADLPVQPGRAPILNDPWALAETASGFTKDNTMSPLQGALIASAIANDGVMMEPYAIQSVHSMDGTELYSASAKISGQPVDLATANEVKALMRETVAHGTSKHAFRKFFRHEFTALDVGGKTGSLTGTDPVGKYDWFVGFAENGPTQRIAVAALTVNEALWRVKSSYLARLAIENYFHGRGPEPTASTALPAVPNPGDGGALGKPEPAVRRPEFGIANALASEITMTNPTTPTPPRNPLAKTSRMTSRRRKLQAHYLKDPSADRP